MGSKYDPFGIHLTFSVVLLHFAAAVRAELRDGSASGERRSLLSQRHPIYISGNEIYYSSYNKLKYRTSTKRKVEVAITRFFSPSLTIKSFIYLVGEYAKFVSPSLKCGSKQRVVKPNYLRKI
jgi:hypothetical protein